MVEEHACMHGRTTTLSNERRPLVDQPGQTTQGTASKGRNLHPDGPADVHLNRDVGLEFPG